MQKSKRTLLADLSLVMVAIIWGTGFIATEHAINANMSTSLIMASRFMIAAGSLLIIGYNDIKKITKSDLKYGMTAGVILFLAFYSQTLGQAYTTVSNTAFITAINVVMVPFIVWVITKKHPSIKTFILSITTLVGVGVLTLSFGKGFSLGYGDLLILLCAFLFALHIVYISIAVKDRDPKRITFIQITTSGLISLFTLFVFDFKAIAISNFTTGLLPVLYLGIFSTCLCFLIQTKAQKYTSPSKTGIILSIEGLFGSVFSVILGMEALTVNLIIGGMLILSSVVFIGVDFKTINIRKNVIEMNNEG